MHIAVDLDDTSLNSLASILLFYNNKHNTCYIRENFLSYRFHDIWGGTLEGAIKEMDEFYDSKYFEKIRPMPGARSALNSIYQDGHRLSVITGRETKILRKTEECIEKYFPNIFSEIYCTGYYGPIGSRMKKSDVCKKNNVDLMIDDDLLHIEDCVNSCIPVLVYGNPWNINSPDGSLRLKNWRQILRVIRILSSI